MLGKKMPPSYPSPAGETYTSVTVVIPLVLLNYSMCQKAWSGLPGFDVRLYTSNSGKNIKSKIEWGLSIN